MSIVKNYVTIHLQLIYIGVLGVAMLLMTYLVEYACVPNETKNLNLNVFSVLKVIVSVKIQKTIFCSRIVIFEILQHVAP